jgi:predicted phage terminase large subunit-like protein
MSKGLIQLNADMIGGFASAYLSPRYDQPHPIAAWHMEAWGMYCTDDPNIAIAAPRKHGKSTALTDAFMLSSLLMRWRRYAVLFSASEALAVDHLARTVDQLVTNEDIIRDFHIVDIPTQSQTDVIVRMRDGWMFRILARGSGQKIRGLNWLNMRPDLLIGDDLESEEEISTREVRTKFRRWFFRSAKQLLGEGGLTRVHGTILHPDSLLAHMCESRSWKHRVYKAHASFNDFSQILWAARFGEAELRAIRQEFIDANDSAGYAAELLNDPRDRDDAYLHRDWFLPLEQPIGGCQRLYGVGVDLAISKSDSANRTSFVVGGKAISGRLSVVDRQRGRWDASEIIERFFEIQERWNPEAFFVEGGVIWLAIEPALRGEMRRRDRYLNIVPMKAVKDKASRGRTMQARMRSGGMDFNKSADWYAEYEAVMLLFTPEADALDDDDFDATAWLVIGMESLREAEPEDAMTEDELDWVHHETGEDGRSSVTGY